MKNKVESAGEEGLGYAHQILPHCRRKYRQRLLRGEVAGGLVDVGLEKELARPQRRSC